MNSSQKDLISIVIPVYNVEKFLKKCMGSILTQSYKNLEIILVNDESTDNSGIICEEYALLDSRVNVIHKKNGGAASARNLGLSVAKGEYIGFVDPDDWIEMNMYESMYNNLKFNKSDVCICNYVIEELNNNFQKKVELPFAYSRFEKHEVYNNIISSMISPLNLDNKNDFMHGAVWRMLIKSELVKQHKIYFLLDMMEDKIFNIQLYFKCNVVSIDPNFHYHYCNHSKYSSSTKFRSDLFELLNKINSQIELIIKQENAFEIFKKHIITQFIRFTIMSVVNEAHPDNKKRLSKRLNKITAICTSKKVQDSLAKINTNDLTFRKRMVLKALQNNNSLLLFLYYSFATRIIDIRQKLKFNRI